MRDVVSREQSNTQALASIYSEVQFHTASPWAIFQERIKCRDEVAAMLKIGGIKPRIFKH